MCASTLSLLNEEICAVQFIRHFNHLFTAKCEDFCLVPQEVEMGGLNPEVAAAIREYLACADVVLLTQLRSKAIGKVVTIGNIHVVWDSSLSPDVKCVQVRPYKFNIYFAGFGLSTFVVVVKAKVLPFCVYTLISCKLR